MRTLRHVGPVLTVFLVVACGLLSMLWPQWSVELRAQGYGVVVTVVATNSAANETGPIPGAFTISRTGDTTVPLTVSFTLGGTAVNGTDYVALGTMLTIPAGQTGATVTVTPISDGIAEGDESAILTLSPNPAYVIGAPGSAVVFISDAGVTTLVSAVLPASRSVQVGTAATAFASMINVGATTATGCSLAPITSLPATFTFQTTDPATNQITGTPDTPVNISAGGTQSFVFALTPTAPIASTDVQLSFDCTNSDPAPITPGLNTLLLSAATTPIPDIVALAATLANDGIVNIPGAAGTGVFAVATVNVGASSTITVSADTGSASLPVSPFVCQTDPATAACLAPPGSSVTTQIDANATPTFGVFVTGSGVVPFNPAVNRVFVRFTDAGGVIRGATSVAVRTQ